ncbi:DUF6095 family protein [Flavobacteriaceae bacterium F89]|uniref:DUF6095 family protein n=1 Tax=Cerina litoralis TaxID=2874477 RepID=A0AAE3EV33_9FLAO|nr:DUF6095 family protein [Cerina litoralis]MCG2461065.1 DUF6095 family protein [Cerina litoralis]
MSKQSFFKSLKFFFYTILLMFTAPVVIYEAFKNQQHPLYWPVLVVGILLAIAAISMGFYSVKLLMDVIFGKKGKERKESK